MTTYVFIVVVILNLYLLYLATSHNKNFPYMYIVADQVTYMLLYFIMDSYPGLISRTRLVQLLLLGLYVLRSKVKIEGSVKLIIIYYLFQLISHLTLQSGNDTIQASTFFGIFILGTTMRHDPEFTKKVARLCYFIICFAALYIYVANSLQYGKRMYGGGFFVGGYGFSRILTVGTASLVLIVFSFKRNLVASKDLIFILIGLVLVMVMMARAPIIVTGSGLFIVMVQQGVKIKNLLYVSIAFCLVFFTLTTVMGSFFLERYQAREHQFEKALDDIEKVTRFKEYTFLPEYISRSSLTKALFGAGFGPTYPYRRMMMNAWQSSIHSGYVYTIYTLGVFGLLLYLTFCARLFSKYRMFRKKKLFLKHDFSVAHNFVQPTILMLLLYNVFNYLVPSQWAYLLLLLCGKFYREYIDAQANERRLSSA